MTGVSGVNGGKINDEAREGKVRFKNGGCPGCAFNCRNKVEFEDKSLPTGCMECGEISVWQAPEQKYYGGKTFGRIAWEATRLSDDLGLEVTAYAGGSLLYDGYLAGIVTEKNTGLPWDKFGSREFMLQYFRMIVYREGFGDIIAQGFEVMTKYIMEHEEFGPNRAQIEKIFRKLCIRPGKFGNAMRRHGVYTPDPLRMIYVAVSEQLGQEPEPFWVGYSPYTPPLPSNVLIKWLGTDKVVDLWYWGPEVAQAAIAHEDIGGIMESMVYCNKHAYNQYSPYGVFLPRNFPYVRLVDEKDMLLHTPVGGPEYLGAIFGRDITWEECMKVGERVINQIRAIWVRDGYTSDNNYDTFWDQFFEETNKDGKIVTPKDKFQQTMQEYYKQRGWKDGVPTRAKLEELDLKDVADQLQSRGLLKG
jgi:aldehyde:ferredoxin oxidoreductase